MFRQSKLITIALCILITLVLSIGCAKSTTTTATTTSTSLTATQVISKASDKLDTINSFHCTLEQTGGGTPIGMGIEMTRVDGDIVRPDRLKATVTGTVSGISVMIQMIAVGEVIYLTNPLTGKWEQLPSQFALLSVFNPNTGITAIMRGITSLAKLSDEQSAGVICYHVSGSIDSENLSPITGSSVKGTTINVELWVGKDDYLVRSIKLIGKITETEVPGIIRTLNLSNFDETISIELPQ
jgi:lipoprotein LprG